MPTKFENVSNALQKIGVTDKWQIRLGFKVWTRGDGCRYKDMDYIVIPNKDDVFVKLCDIAHDTFEISDEFKSIPTREACRIHSIIYINSNKGIEIATRSILRNSNVWSCA